MAGSPTRSCDTHERTRPAATRAFRLVTVTTQDRVAVGDLASAIVSVQASLKKLHVRSSTAAIRLPNNEGQFPDSALADVPPVVVDANVLLSDVLQSCVREGRHTTLVAAANAGLFRLYCAEHVVGEVLRKHEDFAARKMVSSEAFLAVWEEQYVPQLRILPGALPEELLSRAERERIETLRAIDPDDIPSVILSLCLPAYYLSQDTDAAAAVYDEYRDGKQLEPWLRTPWAGGDAGQIGLLPSGAAVLANLSASGVWQLLKLFARAMPAWLQVASLVVGVAAVGYSIGFMPDERKQGFRELAGHVATLIAAMDSEYKRAREVFALAAPTVPSLVELGRELSPDRVLFRACLRALARSRSSACTVRELAALRPALPVAQGEAKVRAILRESDCFLEVRHGRWQLGWPEEWFEMVEAIRSYRDAGC